jgi:hypothetical protein
MQLNTMELVMNWILLLKLVGILPILKPIADITAKLERADATLDNVIECFLDFDYRCRKVFSEEMVIIPEYANQILAIISKRFKKL